jgi:ABC-2 type transport system permease protein
LYTIKQIGISQIRFIERHINEIIENEKYLRVGIDKDTRIGLRSDIRMESIVLTDAGERKGDSRIALVIGYIVGFIMYFVLLSFGYTIMNSVMSEKDNRIIEILVSSIRPSELLFGKIIGIGGVALTQLLIQGILFTIIFAVFVVGVIPFVDSVNVQTDVPMEMQADIATQIVEFIKDPGAINFGYIFFMLLIYSILGYLFYSTMFAAIGSLCEEDGLSQNFTLPVQLPIFASLFIMLNVIDNPHSPLAFWASIIPFSSPIIMLVRIPFSVPVWQLALSIGALIVSFLVMVWGAGKIYKVAIMMYGKKFTWKDLWRFVRV